MNYFGHFVIASWVTKDVGSHFGAMLPDFCAMARVAIPECLPPSTHHGLSLHYRSDEAFHLCPVFQNLCSSGTRRLIELGLTRGPARAASHVGLELLLDGVLAREPSARHGYVRTLADPLGGRAQWTGEGPLAELLSRLRERGVDGSHFEVPALFFRLQRALGRHRRLALVAADERAVSHWLEEAQPQLDAAAPALLAAVRDAVTEPGHHAS